MTRGARATPEHVPYRTCVGCRRRAPAAELRRAVLTADGDVVIDRRGSGRGAWLCAVSAACCKEAIRRKAFGRAFRRNVDPVAMNTLVNAFEADAANVKESRVAGSAPVPLTRGKADR